MHILSLLPQRLDPGATPTFAGFLAGDGTAAAPSISFLNDTDTGLYRYGANVIGVALAGTTRFRFTGTGSGQFLPLTSNEGSLGSAADPFSALFVSTITGYTAGLTLAAGGTNQNITLTPSGTGTVSLPSDLYLTGAGKNIRFFTAGSDYVGMRISSNVINFGGGTVFPVSGYEFYTDSSVGLKLLAGGKALLGTIVDSGALLQIGTNTTTTAGGMVFGTDVNLYRSAADTLKTDDSLAIGNTVAAGVAVASTHKVTMVIGGVTYYLLASNV